MLMQFYERLALRQCGSVDVDIYRAIDFEHRSRVFQQNPDLNFVSIKLVDTDTSAIEN